MKKKKEKNKNLSPIPYCLIPFIFFLLISCSGKDKFPSDTTPPTKPILIQHLGVIGDDDWLTDENNGIDSVSEEDWIRLQWDRLIDNDLKIIRIYRFAKDFQQTPVKVDSLAWNQTQYFDRLTPASIGDFSNIEIDWHYFIRAVDLSNNFTDSDTVSFRLIQKPILEYPDDGTTFEDSSDIIFQWQKQGDSTRMRVLLFDDQTGQLIWKYDEYIFIGDILFEKQYDGEPLQEGTYTWRVDSRGLLDIDGNYYSGSKSRQRKIVIIR